MVEIDDIRQAVRGIVSGKEAVAARLTVQAVVVAAFFMMSAIPAAAQENICSTPIGDFTNGLITAALALGLAAVFLGFVVSFGGRPLAFSRNIMEKLSSMSTGAIVGLFGIVFIAVVFSWVLSYAPIDIPKGCVPL
jgi:vacuolar-type H+-ATPase subunit I/STV1